MNITHVIIAGVIGGAIMLIPKDKRKESGKKILMVCGAIIGLLIIVALASGSGGRKKEYGQFQDQMDTVQNGVDALNGAQKR